MLDTAAVSYLVVLTKADKISPQALEACRRTVTDMISKHIAAFPQVAVTSSEKGMGVAELRMMIASLALPDHERKQGS